VHIGGVGERDRREVRKVLILRFILAHLEHLEVMKLYFFVVSIEGRSLGVEVESRPHNALLCLLLNFEFALLPNQIVHDRELIVWFLPKWTQNPSSSISILRRFKETA
jgi:hypothetical protein